MPIPHAYIASSWPIRSVNARLVLVMVMVLVLELVPVLMLMLMLVLVLVMLTWMHHEPGAGTLPATPAVAGWLWPAAPAWRTTPPPARGGACSGTRARRRTS